jgi:probable addiction module antidote protein
MEAIKARRLAILLMHCLIGEGTRSEKFMSEDNHSYKVDLLDRLKDLLYAQLYLDAAAKESQETFLLALRDVAEAQKGMSQLAEEADVNRENLYRALSEDGNPRLSTLGSVLDALGMEWGITLKHPRHDAAAKK